MNRFRSLQFLGAIGCCMLLGGTASAHSASDAYLSLEIEPQSASTVRVQWDIALRDLDFVLKLDDDGDGNITWAELRRHQAAIGRYARAHLTILQNAKACPMSLSKQMVGDHADGAYAILFLDAHCMGSGTQLTLDYRLFFDIDPSHRAIVIIHRGADTATALMSPQNARIEVGPISNARRLTGPPAAPR